MSLIWKNDKLIIKLNITINTRNKKFKNLLRLIREKCIRDKIIIKLKIIKIWWFIDIIKIIEIIVDKMNIKFIIIENNNKK